MRRTARRLAGHRWGWLAWPCGIHLGLLGLLVVAGMAMAQGLPTEVRVLESLPRGQVNWTEGVVLSRDSATGPAPRGTGALASQAAVQAARQGLWGLLDHVRLDATQMLGPVIRQAEAQRQELEALVARAMVVETRYLPGRTVEMTVQLPLAGRLTALTLAPPSVSTPDGEPRAEAAHTGVVIDARGLAIQPALLPRIVDEQGQPLYAPDLVDVEAAVQQGYIAYARAFDQAPAQTRIGERPLVLRALRVAGASRVDLVLGNPEATRIRDYAATRRLVRQCRVLIVM
jgi:hypothetical protein